MGPDLPDWCHEEEDGSDNESDFHRDGAQGHMDEPLSGERPMKRRRKEHSVKVYWQL